MTSNVIECPNDEAIDEALSIIQQTCRSSGGLKNCCKCPLFSSENGDCGMRYINDIDIHHLKEEPQHKFFD